MGREQKLSYWQRSHLTFWWAWTYYRDLTYGISGKSPAAHRAMHEFFKAHIPEYQQDFSEIAKRAFGDWSLDSEGPLVARTDVEKLAKRFADRWRGWV